MGYQPALVKGVWCMLTLSGRTVINYERCLPSSVVLYDTYTPFSLEIEAIVVLRLYTG